MESYWESRWEVREGLRLVPCCRDEGAWKEKSCVVRPDSRPCSGLYVKGATSLAVGNPCSLRLNRKATYTMACFSARCWAWGGMVDRRTSARLRTEVQCFRQLRNHNAPTRMRVEVPCVWT